MATDATATLDANGIIGLAKADCLDAVRKLFGRCLAPVAVVEEVKDPLSRSALMPAIGEWIIVSEPLSDCEQRLAEMKASPDRDVLALALEHSRAVIVSSDRVLCNRARALGLVTVDVARVVQLLRKADHVVAAKPHLDLMIERGFGISEALYQDVLREVGE